MPNRKFEVFELICNEFRLRDECILTNEFFSTELLQDLQDSFGALTPNAAIEKELQFLERHFKDRGATLPFSYDLISRQFKVLDREFIDFITTVSSMRGQSRRGRQFEEAMCVRLRVRGVGQFHRVGWPRTRKKKRTQLLSHLRRLGFNSRVVYGKDKDGGLDIVWMLPFGAVPHRPLVSFQCKNGAFDIGEADKSYGPGIRSFSCHRGLQNTVHTYCVIFNDYIEERNFGIKPFNFVMLGLSDLVSLDAPVKSVIL